MVLATFDKFISGHVTVNATCFATAQQNCGWSVFGFKGLKATLIKINSTKGDVLQSSMSTKDYISTSALVDSHQYKNKDPMKAEWYSCYWQQGTSKQSLNRHVH